VVVYALIPNRSDVCLCGHSRSVHDPWCVPLLCECVEFKRKLRALDVHCRSYLAMNALPDDLHGAELRRAELCSCDPGHGRVCGCGKPMCAACCYTGHDTCECSVVGVDLSAGVSSDWLFEGDEDVSSASGSGVPASDSTPPTNPSPLDPVGSAVRDTTSPTAAGGVAGEDVPQNQPHEDVALARRRFLDDDLDRICGYCFGPVAECTHSYQEHFMPLGEYPPVERRFLADHPVYREIQDRFNGNQK